MERRSLNLGLGTQIFFEDIVSESDTDPLHLRAPYLVLLAVPVEL